MSVKINNRKDILLLLLYSPGLTNEVNEPVSGRTRLVKMLFLFWKEALPHFRKGTEITEDNFYEFHPWKFGPFSSEIYNDLTFFILQEFVRASNSDEEALSESEGEWEHWLLTSGTSEADDELAVFQEQRFDLTDKGVRFTGKLYSALDRKQKQYLAEFKRRTSGAPLRALLRYVYSEYPEQTSNSTIREEILGGQ